MAVKRPGAYSSKQVKADPAVAQLYVAVGDPGDVFDTDTRNHLETIATDPVRTLLASIRLSMGSVSSRLRAAERWCSSIIG